MNKKPALLWVDDDWSRYKGFLYSLRESFSLRHADSFEAARTLADEEAFRVDCCLLDVILPYRDATPSLGDHVGVTLAHKLCRGALPPHGVAFLTVVNQVRLDEDLTNLRKSYERTRFSIYHKREIVYDPQGIVDKLSSLAANGQGAKSDAD